jgi:hypothetical protein
MTERFHHAERRFLVPHVYRAVTEGQLKLVLPAGRTYEVETVYVDTPERSWSLLSDSSLPKMRVRTYESGDCFFEKKFHSNVDTEKERVKADGVPEGLLAIGYTKYRRTEHKLDGVRVTVDRDVCIDTVAFDMLVIECKGTLPKALRFLKPFEDRKFSKYKALSGKWKSDKE